ncbi:stalk domain-containing protein [uncultured Tyzzerella sp.]|uniref:stalk domain-containing protein n=1 Tax=uncultured Tyzzerella sp. TaxID=2321398 RepID=UPI002942E164|nr:stalk domain-containing protein [uncultured Tyzzerella sp.]
MKKFISGLLIGGIIMTSVSAFAANVVNMKAVYSVKNLIVNGVNTGKGSSAFISNGTTYVPLRTVSDALGHEISWDSKTRSIYINTGNKTPDANGEPTDLPLADTGATTMPTTPNANISNGQKLISMEVAKEAAIKAVGGGSVISQDADIYDDDDIPDYEFKIMKNNKVYEVSINALTGAVIDFDID